MINLSEKIINALKQKFKFYEFSDIEIGLLEHKLYVLKNYNFELLFNKIFKDSRNILSYITELNIAAEIIEFLNGREFNIEYEKKQENGSPDLKININNMIYWVQVKRLSRMRFENVQDKLINEIKDKAGNIKIEKFFNLEIIDDFDTNDIEPFINQLEEKANLNLDNQDFYYPDEEKTKIKFHFNKANKLHLEYLTLGLYIDKGRFISEDIREHLTGSFIKAASSVSVPFSKNEVNIIAVETNNIDFKYKDFADILFGPEQFVYPDRTWHRKNDGLYCLDDFAKKIAFVVTMKNQEESIICNYSYNIFVNNLYLDYLQGLKDLFVFEKVFYYNTFIND